MIVSHRASDPALRPAHGFPVVRVALAVALALALFGGAAYGGSRLLASNDKPSGNPAAANDVPPPAAAPGGEESAGTFPDDSGSPVPSASGSSTAASSSKPPTSPTKKPTQTGGNTGNGGGSGNEEASGPKAEVLRIVNQKRAEAGCGPLTADNRLANAAQGHSADMAANDYFSHTSQNGNQMADRVDAAGYRWRSLGENIAKGQQTPQAVMEAWMNSSGHRANILNCGFRNIGVGLAFDGRSPVWTQNFGTPR
jgi:uncharacterized protein YkwD